MRSQEPNSMRLRDDFALTGKGFAAGHPLLCHVLCQHQGER
jgi:hypothetical protein